MDVTAPATGSVWDGRGLADQDYSSDNQTVSAWWRGFSDDESYIEHYEWCVGTEPGREDVVTCRHVGLHTRSTAELSSAQSSGLLDFYEHSNIVVAFCTIVYFIKHHA